MEFGDYRCTRSSSRRMGRTKSRKFFIWEHPGIWTYGLSETPSSPTREMSRDKTTYKFDVDYCLCDFDL